MKYKTYIVIVSLDPDIAHLRAVAECITSAGCVPVIADNGSKDVRSIQEIPGCQLISLGDNTGIAHAQNKGIECALKNGAEVIGFFDQDSNADAELIRTLTAALENENVKIAAPVSIDAKTGEAYPNHRVGSNGRLVDVYPDGREAFTLVDVAISSGTFVKREVFAKVGLFDESFFIDFVDVEWCLRCRRAGIPITIVNAARMPHSIGESNRKIGPLTVNVHSPYRTYYKVRNAFLLSSKGLGRAFSFSQLLPAVVQNGLLIFDKQRGKEYRKYYFQAIKDGLKKRDGKYEQWHNRT